jgi:ECF transporter S component (folate family)
MRRRNENLIKLTTTSLLMALTILLGRVPGISTYLVIGGVNLIKLSFDAIPLVICALINGSFYGAVCGVGADIIGSFINPAGPYYPGFTIDAALFGILPPLLLKAVKGKRLHEFVACLIVTAFTAIGLYANLPFVSTLKIGSFKMTLSTLWVILIPSIFLVASALVAFLVFLIAGKEKKHAFTLMDVLLAYYVKDLIITPFLAPVWLEQLYGIPYSASFLSQFLIRSLQLLLNVILTYAVLLPVSPVARASIEDTYGVQEVIYTKVYGGKKVS